MIYDTGGKCEIAELERLFDEEAKKKAPAQVPVELQTERDIGVKGNELLAAQVHDTTGTIVDLAKIDYLTIDVTDSLQTPGSDTQVADSSQGSNLQIQIQSPN